jgi:MFS family permease
VLVIAAGYVGRVFLVDSLWQVIVGSTIVSAGTALGYAAMPTLIMRHVPITETASANGLNSLLRAIGTSTASAVVAVILTSTTMKLGPVDVPTLDAFKHIFWIAAFAALASALVAMAIPDRVPATAILQGQPVPVPADRHEIKPVGHEVETVVRGVVGTSSGRPIRCPVVTVLTTDGDHVDWSRGNNDGEYSVVLPGPGRYLMVASADGWAPRSGVIVLGEATTEEHITLSERLTLSGSSPEVSSWPQRSLAWSTWTPRPSNQR